MHSAATALRAPPLRAEKPDKRAVIPPNAETEVKQCISSSAAAAQPVIDSPVVAANDPIKKCLAAGCTATKHVPAAVPCIAEDALEDRNAAAGLAEEPSEQGLKYRWRRAAEQYAKPRQQQPLTILRKQTRRE